MAVNEARTGTESDNGVKSALLATVRSATDLLFPPRCVHCGADGSLFCDRCVAQTTRLRPNDICRTCALPSRTSTCEVCFAEPPELNRAIAIFTYEPAVREAITAFKYRDIRALAPVLGTLMADALPKSVAESSDLIVPVPVSRDRLRSRGYNQSELLARQITKIKQLKLATGLLARTDKGQPQARAQNIDERRRNVQGAFEVIGSVNEKRILLIDDVMTTGSTLNACAAVLKDAGAAWVGALVLTREL